MAMAPSQEMWSTAIRTATATASAAIPSHGRARKAPSRVFAGESGSVTA
jgi:hypothetical protein